MIGSVTTTQLTNKLYRYQNYDRKQVKESTSRFLLLIDKQLTNTSGIFLRAFLRLEQLESLRDHWEVKLGHLRRKTYEDKYVIRDKNQPTVLANSSNSWAWRHNANASTVSKHVHGKFHILCLESKYVETILR